MKVTIGHAQGWSVDENKVATAGRDKAIAAAEGAIRSGSKKPILRMVPVEYREFCLEQFAALQGAR
jgi:hypothetical protein